jgi:hypothetical protein
MRSVKPPQDLLPMSTTPDPVIEAYSSGIDQTLIRENLKLSTQQRVDKLLASLRLVEEIKKSQPIRRP